MAQRIEAESSPYAVRLMTDRELETGERDAIQRLIDLVAPTGSLWANAPEDARVRDAMTIALRRLHEATDPSDES